MPGTNPTCGHAWSVSGSGAVSNLPRCCHVRPALDLIHAQPKSQDRSPPPRPASRRMAGIRPGPGGQRRGRHLLPGRRDGGRLLHRAEPGRQIRVLPRLWSLRRGLGGHLADRGRAGRAGQSRLRPAGGVCLQAPAAGRGRRVRHHRRKQERSRHARHRCQRRLRRADLAGRRHGGGWVQGRLQRSADARAAGPAHVRRGLADHRCVGPGRRGQGLRVRVRYRRSRPQAVCRPALCAGGRAAATS